MVFVFPLALMCFHCRQKLPEAPSVGQLEFARTVGGTVGSGNHSSAALKQWQVGERVGRPGSSTPAPRYTLHVLVLAGILMDSTFMHAPCGGLSSVLPPRPLLRLPWDHVCTKPHVHEPSFQGLLLGNTF